MARKQHDPPIPAGLTREGSDLWVRLTTEVDFPPEKLMGLEQLCRTLGIVTKLQSLVDGLESWRVSGSMKQPVIAPELDALAKYRSLLISQTRALDITDDVEDLSPPVYLSPSELGKRGAAARWGNRRGA